MKNLYTLAALLILVGSFVNAQNNGITDNRKKFQFEMKAGVNYSNVYNSNTEFFDANAKYGFAGGLVIKLPIGKYLGVDVGAILSQKGFKARGAMMGSSYILKRTLNYLDFPLLFALKPNEFITLVAGPQYSYLVKRQDVFASTELNYDQLAVFKNDDIRKNTIGFSGGVDINLKHVTLGARINFDAFYNNGINGSATPQYKNTWFQGTIGYSFYKND